MVISMGTPLDLMKIKIKKPFWGFSLLLALIFILFVLIGLELICRAGLLDQSLPLESHGLDNIQFDIKWIKLQEYLEKYGGVDVIFMGSSLVNTGIDPQVIAQEYQNQTGSSLRIFNFGTEGLSIVATENTVKMVIQQAHPKVIVLVTEMRDFYTRSENDISVDFNDHPWVRHLSGDKNVTGWLVNNSALLKKALLLRNWMQYDFLETLKSNNERLITTQVSGYEPDFRMRIDYLAGYRLRDLPEPIMPGYRSFYDSGFIPDIDSVSALEAIIKECQSSGVQIILVDMPARPSYINTLGGETEHEKYVSFLGKHSSENNIVLIPAMPYENISIYGWSNPIHLNRYGAPVFSRYVGNQLVALLKNEYLLLSPKTSVQP